MKITKSAWGAAALALTLLSLAPADAAASGYAADASTSAYALEALLHDHPDGAALPPQVAGHYHEGELGELYLELEHSFKCDCSCGLDVHSCQFQMQCGTSPGWSARIRRELEAGMTAEAIQAGFVADYGMTVLMAPPAEGFNLVGYLLPGMAIVMAGMLVGLIAKGGTGRLELAPVENPTDEQSERLRDALKKLEETDAPDW